MKNRLKFLTACAVALFVASTTASNANSGYALARQEIEDSLATSFATASEATILALYIAKFRRIAPESVDEMENQISAILDLSNDRAERALDTLDALNASCE